MPSRIFTPAELDEFVTTNTVLKESRGRGKWTEIVDIVFCADDDRMYHVVLGVTRKTYLYCYDGDAIECPEVELYATSRPKVMFRKVPDVELSQAG